MYQPNSLHIKGDDSHRHPDRVLCRSTIYRGSRVTKALHHLLSRSNSQFASRLRDMQDDKLTLIVPVLKALIERFHRDPNHPCHSGQCQRGLKPSVLRGLCVQVCNRVREGRKVRFRDRGGVCSWSFVWGLLVGCGLPFAANRFPRIFPLTLKIPMHGLPTLHS